LFGGCYGSRSILNLVTELAWLIVSGATLLDLNPGVNHTTEFPLPLLQAGALVSIYICSFYLMDLYDSALAPLSPEMLWDLAQAIGLSFVGIGILERHFELFALPPSAVILHAGLTTTFVICGRIALEHFGNPGGRAPYIAFIAPMKKRVPSEREQEILAARGIRVGFFAANLSEARRTLQDPAVVRTIHRVIIDDALLSRTGAVNLVRQCERSGLRLERLSSYSERAFGKLHLGPQLVVELAAHTNAPFAKLYSGFRRVRDLTIASIAILILLPVCLLIAVAIKCDSPGPVLFLQDRVGQNGRRFKMIKFRSMDHVRKPCDGPSWTTAEHDPRVTRIGRLIRGFHLDELPQLLNVLRGDMSLVGPRPFHPSHFAKLASEPYFSLRLQVLPGMTGWAQIRCSYADSLDNYKEVLARDLYYIKHAGLIFDFIIMIETIRICLWRRGAL
jgi:lipopolysaccharide/colanic/teichoic acid biosynthesis glycosyltransferase